MTDPFLLDQKEVEVTLKRLEDAVSVRRQMQKEKRSEYSDSLEYEFHGVESSIRNAIRDIKWSLDDLEETLKLMSENRGHFVNSDDLKVRRSFLEAARKTLADVEFEISSPSVQEVIELQQLNDNISNNSSHSLANQAANSTIQTAVSQPEEVVGLLRADSDEEQLVFEKSHVSIAKPKQLMWSQKQAPVASMVSLNLDVVRDMVEPPGIRRTVKSLIDKLSLNRCWLYLALLIIFFLVLVTIKAVSRRGADMVGMTTTMQTTTACADENMNCI